jgi:hypothetical protein
MNADTTMQIRVHLWFIIIISIPGTVSFPSYFSDTD